MATLSSISSALIPPHQSLCSGLQRSSKVLPCLTKPNHFIVRAAKLPVGVEVPKMQPKLTEPFLGFTKTAEIWNFRACMMGLIGTFIVELTFHKGILQMIGVDVGKGLDIPL